MSHLRLNTLLPALLLSLATSATLALPREHAADAIYRQDRAACLSGQSTQDRATCLKEAGAARAEARRQSLDNGESPAQLRANALRRCQRVLEADRGACERMALGEGSRSGSVAGGGVLTEITTPVPAVPPSAAASR